MGPAISFHVFTRGKVGKAFLKDFASSVIWLMQHPGQFFLPNIQDPNDAKPPDLFALCQTPAFFNRAQKITRPQEVPTTPASHGFLLRYYLRSGERERNVPHKVKPLEFRNLSMI